MTEPRRTGPVTGTGSADPRRWRALMVCLVAGFMALLDVSIVNVALPSIRSGLGAHESDLQWVVSGYALAFGVVLVAAGRFGDARGRRGVFVTGVACFTLASAGAGLATTPGLLIAARIVQGLAGGVINPQITGLIQQLFRGAERGRAFGLLGATIGVSTAVGPILGGLLIHLGGTAHGWRWIFFINVPVGVVAVLLALRLVPAGPDRAPRVTSLDPVGMLLLGAGVLLVLVPLVEGQQLPGPAKWLLLLAGAAVLAGFWGWERRYARTREPVVDPGLFTTRSYLLGCLIALLYFGGFTAIFFVSSLYLQSGRDYSALVTGLALSPFALGSAAAAAMGGRVVTRLGRPLVAGGLVLVALGVAGTALAVTRVPAGAAAWAVAAPLLVAGVGSGLVISPNITLTLAEVPVVRAGVAGGVLQTGQRIGAAAGIAGIGFVFFTEVSAGGDWARAYQHALLVTLALVTAALVTTLVDVRATRNRPR